MEYSDIQINRKQVQQLAFAIIADIEVYVGHHQDEYQEFLKNEKIKEVQDNDN